MTRKPKPVTMDQWEEAFKPLMEKAKAQAEAIRAEIVEAVGEAIGGSLELGMEHALQCDAVEKVKWTHPEEFAAEFDTAFNAAFRLELSEYYLPEVIAKVEALCRGKANVLAPMKPN